MHSDQKLAALCSSAILCVACGSDSHPSSKYPDGFGDYAEEGVTSIGERDPDAAAAAPGAPVGDTPVQVGTPSGDGSVCFDDGLCEVPATDDSNFCEREGGPVDLIYADGKLVEVICYPPAEDPDRPVETIDGTSMGDIDVAQNANKTTVVFSDETNGMPFEGDIAVDGNNVAIYGNGADNTVIDGEVSLDGNNVRLRGVTITGDLIIRKNNVAVVLCKILGNVVLETSSTNGSIFAENDIYGSFTSDSNGNTFVGNDVLGQWSITGSGNTCDRNHAFSDKDGDEVVDDTERGAELPCE